MTKSVRYQRIASLKKPDQIQSYLDKLAIPLPYDRDLKPSAESPLGQSYTLKDGFRLGNRFCILAMEGWDGTAEGLPSEETRRRWHNFGRSGAKLIWGGEAVAVSREGRANPNQLYFNEENIVAIQGMRAQLVEQHELHFGRSDDLLVGLQLTHSGRFSRPDADHLLKPRILYAHPVLDHKFTIDTQQAMMSDDEIRALIANYVKAAKMAHEAGFGFVDIKHCHGYLGHEFLSAYDRPGPYGGSFENRTRFIREIVAGIREAVPQLRIGVRVSAFDWVPFRKDADNIGEPEPVDGQYSNAFGGQGATGIDLSETLTFLELLKSLGIELVCVTAGSPYYNPHIQRPALYPPSDGYLPPEDPLLGVARQIEVTAKLKQAFPDFCIVGSAYSYLQELLPNVAQHVVRSGMADFVGLGRLVLSYPDFPADVLGGRPLKRKLWCRTFSDCTSAPRNGMISGCYPLDDFYKQKEEAKRLKIIKKEMF